MALLPGNATMREARSQLAGNPAAAARLKALLGPLAGYDVIIIDTPPELDFPSASAVLAAHLCLLPTDLSQQSLDALEDTVRFGRTLLVQTNARSAVLQSDAQLNAQQEGGAAANATQH